MSNMKSLCLLVPTAALLFGLTGIVTARVCRKGGAGYLMKIVQRNSSRALSYWVKQCRRSPSTKTNRDLTERNTMQSAIKQLAAVWPQIIGPLLPLLRPQPSARGQVYSWTTIVGTAAPGSADGTNSDAKFNLPARLAVNSAGIIYTRSERSRNG